MNIRTHLSIPGRCVFKCMRPSMKVLLISDSPLVITGLRAVILDTIHTPHFTEASILAEALPLCRRQPFELVIIDISKLDTAGIDQIAALKTAFQELTIWVNLRSDFTLLRWLLKSGVNGILSSKSASAEFGMALRSIDNGGRFIGEEIQKKLVSAFIGDSSWSSLTVHQEKVAGLLAAGLSNQSIADQIGVKSATITHYRQIIFKKLGIASLTELRQKWTALNH